MSYKQYENLSTPHNKVSDFGNLTKGQQQIFRSHWNHLAVSGLHDSFFSFSFLTQMNRGLHDSIWE
jgi:hypothetical protein